ncbi:protein ecdysoneless [Cimex lectularius]|uniref:Ecdysoneless n=1 Tax=Cimex lectularius TaxID=79782 RepID=A0A8I6RCA0_CIMLE|nr:protein ecdysoneless [Cimex lectularius]
MAFKRDVLENVREDDFVEYLLFPGPSTNLTELKVNVDSFTAQKTKNYIWQKDEFQVIVRNTLQLPPIVDNEEKLPPHLYGVTHYGENIEDEWFIVYLLLQLTKSVPDLIARVTDVDGEFLLIEAADFLPKWANPEVCDKRVYIVNGEVHVIPVTKECETITVTDALKWIRMYPELTRTTDAIQKAIENRVSGYPDKIQELLHQTNAYVPAGVAALLKEKPSLIAPAITSFCYRDPIDLRACRAMRYFPPETRVMTQVKMTRCLYAMLVHHKYIPDRRTGWDLPPANSKNYLAHSLGVKLACGFEILVTQCKGRKGSEDDLENDKGWHRYKQSLNNRGYFKDLLVGCVEYRQLEQEAKLFYRSHSTQHSQPSSGQTILNLLDSIELDIESMKKAEENLPPPDDDSWMEISANDLDKILTERYGSTGKSSVNDISSHLNSFLEHVSSFEGAEHPKANRDSVPLRPKRKDQVKSTDDENNRISFDQEAFSCAVQNILDFSVPEDSWDLDSEESGMSSYEDEVDMDLSRKKTGKEPNSQEAEGEKSEFKQYMDQMDRELSTSTLAHSFHKSAPKGMEDSFSDIESFEPVDIDRNALKNILESYRSQMGGAGPASNLLGPMGVRLEEE